MIAVDTAETALADRVEEVAMRLRCIAGLCSVLGERTTASHDRRVGEAFDSLSFSINAECDIIQQLLGGES